MINLGIIGYGIVGKATAHGFKRSNYKIYHYDKFVAGNTLEETVKKSQIIFICLPTPYKGDRISLSIIDENIAEITKVTDGTDKIIVIKSTVIPGTTANYSKKYPKSHFIFNPEFLTEAHANEDFINADRIVIGGEDKKSLKIVEDLYKKRFPKTPIFVSGSKTAEMVKYMANCYLATKVMFANEIHSLCEKLNIPYKDVKKMVTADKRIFDSHLDITEHKGFGGKCFPKDMIAIMGLYKDIGVDHSLLKTVWEKNLKIRQHKDWEEIPFVKE